MEIKQRANGRWRDILNAMGIESRFLVNRHGPCPICEGKDRFRFDDKGGDGSFFCSHCGAGDGIKLVMLKRSESFIEAVRWIETIVGTARVVQPKAANEHDRCAAMNTLWRSGSPLKADSAAGRYLTHRIGYLPVCGDLRGIERLRHGNPDSKVFTICAGLLTLVRNPEGVPVNLHRTYLTSAGRKANVDPVRKLMAGTLPPGSSARLAPVSNRLAIAEGIETALSVTALFDVPCWAAINAGNLAKFEPPPGVEQLAIYADADAHCVGQSAAYRLAERLAKRKITVSVHVPATVGNDWNDELSATIERQGVA